MKAQEKKLIFNLLKTASDNFYGYTSPEFIKTPDFKDDVDISDTLEQAEKIKGTDNIAAAEKIENINSEEKPSQDRIAPGGLTIETLNKKIMECSRCQLSQKRTKIVPGQGVSNPEVLVIGEAPGEEEDKQGLPFVGPAGKLLDKMLNAIQLDRFSNCYIANTVKCRPPYNRDPQKEEAECCRSFLDAQIAVLKPKMILALGKVAIRNLLKLDGEFSLNRYRGQFYSYGNIPLVVTYHPSALLRNIEFKKPAWEDLKFLKAKLLAINPDYAKEFRPE